MPRSLRVGWLTYLLLLCIFAVWAYGLTAPNLILTGWTPYWNFQLWMWRTFFDQRQVLTISYVVLVSTLFATYLYLWFKSRSIVVLTSELKKSFVIWWSLLLAPLIVGYNALSHDIFNYIFNARMIVLYKASPYEKLTLDFAYDDWTRFMHNTHLLTPYGYGWTGMTLIPYFLGFGKFLITWIIFKVVGAVSLWLQLLVTLFKTEDTDRGTMSFSDLVLIFLHPLMLLEFGLSAHNDVWMMVPAVLSFVLLEKTWKKTPLKILSLSLTLLFLSISMKIVTVILLPLWLGLVIVSFTRWSFLKRIAFTFWPVLAALMIFTTLFTHRSQYFHPWYMSWVLVWVPFFPNQIKHEAIRTLVIFFKYVLWCFALTSLFRYLPWMWNGGYPAEVIFQQRVITYSALPLAVITFSLWWLAKHFSFYFKKSVQ